MRGFSPCFLCSSFAALVGSKRYGLNLYGDAMSRRLRIFRLRIVEYICIYIYIIYIYKRKSFDDSIEEKGGNGRKREERIVELPFFFFFIFR